MAVDGEIIKKRAVGRPLKFKNPKQLQEAVDNYFSQVTPRQYTITGLALALDVDRDTLLNYQDRPEFFGTIKRAKTQIEYGYELSLRERGSAGDIFGLKNFGWVDKQEVDQTINLPTPIVGGMAKAELNEGDNDASDN